jgi:CheY-like chemotaxis protein
MTTVLVVDDEPLIAMVLKEALEDENYRVLTAANGKQGLERLIEERADVVLLDIMMPVMSGPAMLRAMAAHPNLRGIPAIILSSLPEVTIRAKTDSVAAVLQKPYTTEEVVRTITRVLGKANKAES